MPDARQMNETAVPPATSGLSAKLALAVLVLLMAGIVVIAPSFLDTYLVNILIRAFFVAIAAITVDIMWGYCGTLTFGQSAFFGIGVYALAITFTEYGFGTWQALLALGATLAITAVVAGLTGWLSFYPGSTPLYASIVSLVVPIVLVQILYSGGTFTGSSSGLVGFESFDLDFETWFRLAGLSLIAVAIVALIVMRSDTGRFLTALRDNDARCTYLGIDTSRTRIIVLVLTALVAGLAGFGYAAFGAVAAPENASFTFGTRLIIMVALGGRGTVIGAIVGALSIEVASAYLSGSLPYVWELIIGLALIAVILAFPDGLVGVFKKLVRGFIKFRPTDAIHLQPLATHTVTDDRSEIAIEVRGLGKHFGSLSVLDGVQFTAHRAELLSLVGPNGAGKTTLIRCLSDGRERSTRRRRHRGPADRPFAAGPYRPLRPRPQIPDGIGVRDADGRRMPARRTHPARDPIAGFDIGGPGIAGRRDCRAGAIRPCRALERGSAQSEPRIEAGARACHGARTGAGGAAARRTDGRPDPRRTAGFCRHPDHAGGARSDLHPAGGARSRFRLRDILSHHRAASGPHRPRWLR